MYRAKVSTLFRAQMRVPVPELLRTSIRSLGSSIGVKVRYLLYACLYYMDTQGGYTLYLTKMWGLYFGCNEIADI